MRYAIILLLIAAGLTLGGTYLSHHEGYVELGLSGGTYQMPLWYFLIALVVAIVALMIVFKVLWTIIRLPAITRRFGKNRRKLVANDLLQKGMLAMGKGHWKKAENLLVKGSRVAHKANRDPGLFLATAAQAAQQQGADARRDQYLLEARQLSAEGVDTFTTALSEARLHLNKHEPQKALDAIAKHRHSNLLNPELQSIEAEANEQLGNYDVVWDVLSRQKKHFKSKEAFKARQNEVATALFNAEHSTLEKIERTWSELPRAAKADESLFLNYISGLIHHGQEEKAEQLLAKAVRKDFSDPLIHAYTQLEVGSSNARLETFRKWLRYRGDNAYLNYGAAKFAYQSEQFDVAKEYAETSIKSQPLPETFALLGKIYEALGEHASALNAYKGSVGLIYADEPQAIAGDVLPAPAETAALPSGDTADKDNVVTEQSPKAVT